ncbi:MAG: tetratricopeptide repeat protein [Myxococcaceae bacterium]|nr:tetratricopeptide repeat protein [Myxococcaceae bacterium]
MRTVVLAALCLFSSCLTIAPSLREVTPVNPAALDAAAEAFYRATSTKALKEAVEAARAAGPDSATFHELAAALAALEAREPEEIAHLQLALLDTSDQHAPLHLHLLMQNELSFAQRRQVRGLLDDLVERHPKPEVRSLAAFHLASLLTAEGQLGERDELIASQPGRFPLAVVGTWDNDQGKGFDQQLAPEVRPGLDQQYEGRFGPLTWRRGPPLDPRGRLELSSLMTPARFAVAFVQGTVEAPQDGFYQLRVATSGPLKVWVDGKLLFSASILERSVWDNVVVPLSLSKGPHTVLFKSAHREGAWSLAARLVPAASVPFAVPNLEAMVKFATRAMPPLAARTKALEARWAHLAAGGPLSVKTADAFVREFPDSVLARTLQADALWFNQERGRAGDALAALDAALGRELTFVRLRQLRFWQQQGLKQKARAGLLELLETHPGLPEVHELLIEAWRGEGWTEDELDAQRAQSARFGDGADSLLARGRSLLRFGRRREAEQAFEAVLRELPFHPEALRRLADLSLDAGELDRAEALLEARLESWPTDFGTWMLLAEVRRRARDLDGASAALEKAAGLAPEAANPWVKRGELAYERGDRTGAVAAWKRALERNPENDSLANRVDFLSPEARGPWQADVPDEAAIAELVQTRGQLRQTPGADVAWLLDDEVTLLNTDGSTSNVVTVVIHAFNAQGRDRIMKQTVPAGRLRVLHAWVIDDKGVRSEASSERSRQIFFRGMQPGSTLVLQYRLDVPPSGYLARHLTKSWSFQSVAEQRRRARFVMWMPLGTTLNEHRVGAVERREEKRGEQLRVEWFADESPPLVSEPAMPPLLEVAANIRLSTVPDWHSYLSWEKSLLDGVFRDSPEIDAVARRLGAGAPDATEKLERVHQFVMEEIRYQQDYESFIAGVKPHAAPMVLERRYGDCKDKAVLFITLARKLGLEVHFANVRTRDSGQISKDVPMQQFNHAIVYVPKQPGLPEDRFFDPTADLLDLDVVRHDDVGTTSLVIDPVSGEHTFREIPWQSPDKHRLTSQLELDLAADGSARGLFTLEARGRGGAAFRVASRDAEMFGQAVQRIASGLVPNATTSDVAVVEAKDLRKPAALKALLEARTFARPEGESLRIKVPTGWNPRGQFSLATRRHPLVLGTPFTDETRVSVTLPEGFEVKKLPASGALEQTCLKLERTVTQAGRTITSRAVFRVTCDRVTPAEYPAYRAKVDEMMRLLEDELVVGKAATPAGKKPVPAKPKP